MIYTTCRHWDRSRSLGADLQPQTRTENRNQPGKVDATMSFGGHACAMREIAQVWTRSSPSLAPEMRRRCSPHFLRTKSIVSRDQLGATRRAERIGFHPVAVLWRCQGILSMSLRLRIRTLLLYSPFFVSTMECGTALSSPNKWLASSAGP